MKHLLLFLCAGLMAATVLAQENLPKTPPVERGQQLVSEDSAAPPLAKLPTVDEEIRRAADAAPLKMQFRGSTPAELAAWQPGFSSKLRRLIGPHTPPKQWKVKVISTREFPDHTREELLLEADAEPSLPLYVLRPRAEAGKRFPIVLCLHGHGEFGHDAVAGVDDTPALKAAIRNLNYDYGRQLVREGYLAIVPCFTPFGRRLDPRERERRTDPCAIAFVRLMFLGRTLLGENLRDALWALDYATARTDARADRVGCVGLSYGGRMTMVVTALDPRVRVAVISGALNVFQERVQGAGYSCGAQVIPGLLEFGDTPEIGALIAPRPVIWEAGRRDGLMVPGWLEKASARIEHAYAAAGKPENLEIHRFDGGHVWNGETAIPLLAKVLKE
ncbi:MAG: alpha/beta hydrolase family protein [Verrucomicrobiota bacterium]|nr:alpha/beta hydrolase family protein [Verrucomicrobiota bacterium]